MKYADEAYYGNDKVEIRGYEEEWHWNPETLETDIPGYEIVLPGQNGIYDHQRATRWVREGELHELPLWERLARVEKALGLG